MGDSYLKDLFINEAKPALNKNQVVRQKGYDEGFDAGKQAEYDAFWDAYLRVPSSRMSYGMCMFAGAGWNDNVLKPPRGTIINIKYAYMTFAYNIYITDLDEWCEKNGITIDFSQSTSFTYTFYGMDKTLKKVGTIDCRLAPHFNSVFYGCEGLHTVGKIVFSDDGSQKITSAFNVCGNLQNLTIEGVIGKNGLNVSWSTKLTHDSLMSIINALKDYSEDTSGTDWVVTIGSENYAKLTEEEREIAENKGWRIV